VNNRFPALGHTTNRRLARCAVAGGSVALVAGALTAIPAGAGERPARQTATSAAASAATPLAAQLLGRTQLRTSPGGHVAATLETVTEYGTRRVLAVVARHGRWLGVLSDSLPNSRVGWIAERNAALLVERYALDLDRSARLLTVRRDGRVVRRIRVAVGTSATATPIGRFAVTDAFRVRDGSGAYGCCAMPITGHQTHLPADRNRLAIHGTSAEGSIGAAASGGCLRARRTDMRWLLARVAPGTQLRIRA
jgi:lipoprotein-anchoring transpeptidase ErfK/SrfK